MPNVSRWTHWRMAALMLGWALILASGLTTPCEAQDSIMEIKSLASLYGGVNFDHDMHMDLADDCSVCHHHTTGTGVTDQVCAPCHSDEGEGSSQACSDCHPVEPFSAEYLRQKDEDQTRYHKDIPGLKAAYHLNCLGCHTEMGAVIGCDECHPRTDAGDRYYHSGVYAPKGGDGSKTSH